MLSGVIENVRGGLMKPEAFRKAERTRRTLNFSLSSTRVDGSRVKKKGIFSLDLDCTNRFLLAGSSDGSWYVHDTFNFTQSLDHEKKCVLRCSPRTHHTRSISTVEWFPSDNGAFSTSGYDGFLCIWDANNPGQPVDKYDREEPIYRHHTNPVSGSVIAVCAGGEVNLIDIRIGSSIQKLPEVHAEIKEVRWNPFHQSQLMVASQGGNLIEWDIRSTFQYKCYGVDQVRLSRRPVVTRGSSGITTDSTTALLQAHTGSIDSMRFSSDGQELYTFGASGKMEVRRWKMGVTSDPCIGTLRYGKKHKGRGNFSIGVADNVDPPIVFAPNSTSVVVCDMKDCQAMKELVGHFKQVNCFVYDETYQQGYSGGNDAGIIVWSGNKTTEQTYVEEKAKKYGCRESIESTFQPKPLIDLDDDDD
ncbi:DNA excision repair protein ERCC-8 [Orchesella cincta]|uniref:DNA excision repair protein ERCC-8 n=1 Tax=Orchesella cincta TaxID=48709 RepID=A0A1D2MI47_ORCCI|nr:DNA excision repair protein ERCC-8 [Orchesella cincta]